MTISFVIFFVRVGAKHIDAEIEEFGGVVIPVVVNDKHASIKSSEWVKCQYEVDGNVYSSKIYCDIEVYNKITIGDTILIIYSIRCPERNLLYKFFPTSKEIAKFKNGCYYIDGHLVDSIE